MKYTCRLSGTVQILGFLAVVLVGISSPLWSSTKEQQKGTRELVEQKDSFDGTNFDGVDLSKLTLTNKVFKNCSFKKTNFSSTKLSSITFDSSAMDESNFSGATLNTVSFEDATGLETIVVSLKTILTDITPVTANQLFETAKAKKVVAAIRQGKSITPNQLKLALHSQGVEPINQAIKDSAGAGLTITKGKLNADSLGDELNKVGKLLLKKAQLEGAYLGGIDFTGTDLSGANLREATIEACLFGEKSNLENSDLTNAKITNTRFIGASMLGTRGLETVNFSGSSVIFDKVKFDGACFRGDKTGIGKTELWRRSGRVVNKLFFGTTTVSTTNPIFEGDCSHISFVGADNAGTNIPDPTKLRSIRFFDFSKTSDLRNSNFSGLDTTGCNFGGTNMAGCLLDGSILALANFYTTKFCEQAGTAFTNGASFKFAVANGTSFAASDMRAAVNLDYLIVPYNYDTVTREGATAEPNNTEATPTSPKFVPIRFRYGAFEELLEYTSKFKPIENWFDRLTFTKEEKVALDSVLPSEITKQIIKNKTTDAYYIEKREHPDYSKSPLPTLKTEEPRYPTFSFRAAPVLLEGTRFGGATLTQTAVDGLFLPCGATETKLKASQDPTRYGRPWVKSNDIVFSTQEAPQKYEGNMDSPFKLVAAMIPGAIFDSATLNNANFNHTDGTGASLKKATINNTKFIDAIFSSSNFEDAKITESEFNKAKLGGSNFEGVVLTGGTLEGTQLSNATFKNTKFSGGIDLADTNMRGALFGEKDKPVTFSDAKNLDKVELSTNAKLDFVLPEEARAILSGGGKEPVDEGTALDKLKTGKALKAQDLKNLLKESGTEEINQAISTAIKEFGYGLWLAPEQEVSEASLGNLVTRFTQLNLQNAVLDGITLSKLTFDTKLFGEYEGIAAASISRSWLKDCSFSNSNLVGVSFKESKLERTKLTNTPMDRADFSDGKIEECDFSNISMIGAKGLDSTTLLGDKLTSFTGLILDGIALRGPLSGTNQTAWAEKSGKVFSMLLSSKAKISGLKFEGNCSYISIRSPSTATRTPPLANYPKARFLDFSNSDISHADFSYADLTGSNFSNCWAINSTFEGSVIALCSFRNSAFCDYRKEPVTNGSSFKYALANGTDFSYADLRHAKGLGFLVVPYHYDEVNTKSDAFTPISFKNGQYNSATNYALDFANIEAFFKGLDFSENEKTLITNFLPPEISNRIGEEGDRYAIAMYELGKLNIDLADNRYRKLSYRAAPVIFHGARLDADALTLGAAAGLLSPCGVVGDKFVSTPAHWASGRPWTITTNMTLSKAKAPQTYEGKNNALLSFVAARMPGTILEGAIIRNASFENAQMTGSNVAGVKFIDCNLTNFDLSNSNLIGVHFEGNTNVKGLILSGGILPKLDSPLTFGAHVEGLGAIKMGSDIRIIKLDAAQG